MVKKGGPLILCVFVTAQQFLVEAFHVRVASSRCSHGTRKPNDFNRKLLIVSDQVLSSSASPRVENNRTETIELLSTSLAVSSSKYPAVPTFRDCLSFVLPALGIYTCPTLMSLIDASFIGRSSSLELAALGPASAISDSASLPLLFVSIAATNLIAKAFADQDDAGLARIARTALGMGAAGGVLLSLLLVACVAPLASLYCGSTGGGLVPPCVQYVTVRALALPAVVLATVAQAVCIGTKDTRTPLLSVALAGGANLLGDFLFVTWLDMGIAGAAWATAMSQVLCTMLLLQNLRKRGFLRREGGTRTSTMQTVKQILSFIPFLFVMVVKIGLHNSCAATAASFGGAQAAAQTALAAIGMLCFTFGDVGSSLSQAFIPAFVQQPECSSSSSNFDLDAAMPTVKQLMKCTISISTTVVCLASVLIGGFGGQITSDPAVLHEMIQALPWIATALIFHGSAVTLEGLLLAQKKFRGLSIWYTILAFTIAAFQVCTRRWGLGLKGVWGCYVWVSFSRVVAFSFIGGLLRPRRWWQKLREIASKTRTA